MVDGRYCLPVPDRDPVAGLDARAFRTVADAAGKIDWNVSVDATIGNAEPLVDSVPYAASVAVWFMMASYSIGVNFPSRR